jgi:hypothetical protein
MPKNGSKTIDSNRAKAGVPPPGITDEARVRPLCGTTTLRQLESGCFDHGFERAVSGGALDIRPEDLEALEEFARARAQVEQRTSFDPSSIAHDQLRENDFRIRQVDLKEAKDAERHAGAHLRQSEQQAAQAHSRLGARPRPSVVLMIAAVIVFAITVAPTLHDFVFHTLSDELTAWFMALMSGVFAGVLLACAILGLVGGAEEGSALRRGGAIAGAVLCLGLGVLRVSAVEAWGEVVFALGLTLVEIGVICTLEFTAGKLRAALAGWAERKAAADEGSAVQEAAEAHFRRCQQCRRELEDQNAAYQAHVEDRYERSRDLAAIEGIAQRSVRAGYTAGVSANRGRVQGVEE